jgi:hypothetical protein
LYKLPLNLNATSDEGKTRGKGVFASIAIPFISAVHQVREKEWTGTREKVVFVSIAILFI